jgi:L-asparagine oxygenase
MVSLPDTSVLLAEYRLSHRDLGGVTELLDELTKRYESAQDPDFLEVAPVYAQELPRSLRLFLNAFRLREDRPGCILRGYEVDDARLGRTPSHWREHPTPSPSLREEMLLVLYGSLLGDVFGWSTQQDGAIIHSVLPIKDDEFEQLGSGSRELLWWHTEDAFHPLRADYLALFCLRNPDRVATTVSSAEVLALDQAHVDLLTEERFVIRPDNSHLQKNNVGGDFTAIEERARRPRKVAVLHGDRTSPYLRLDPYFMDPLEDDPEAQDALDALTHAIEANLLHVALEPGECLVLDNYLAVHGRAPFSARYDGDDRWLKRINITRDLRKSRVARGSANGRIIAT